MAHSQSTLLVRNNDLFSKNSLESGLIGKCFSLLWTHSVLQHLLRWRVLASCHTPCFINDPSPLLIKDLTFFRLQSSGPYFDLIPLNEGRFAPFAPLRLFPVILSN